MKLTIEFKDGTKIEKILDDPIKAWKILDIIEPKEFLSYKEFIKRWIVKK